MVNKVPRDLMELLKLLNFFNKSNKPFLIGFFVLLF